MGVNGIYGLSGSGLDIESMVKVGMMGKQNEYDKMAQKYTKNEWTKAAYLEISSSISTFNMTKLSDYKMSSSMNSKTADSTSSAVKVSANATAAVMSHRVQVTQLASSAYLVGEQNSIQRKNTNASDSIYLADALFKSISTNDDGESFSVTFGTNTDGSDITGTFGKNDVALRFTLADGTKDDDGDAKTKTIEFTYGDLYGKNGGIATFNTLASKINSSGLNIKAAYDTVNDSFSLYNSKGGKDNTISFTLEQVTGTKQVQKTDENGNPAVDENGNPVWVTETDENGNEVIKTELDTDYVKYANTNDDDSLNSLAALTTRDFLNNLNLQQSAKETLTAVSFTTGETKAITGDSGKIMVDGVTYTTDDNKVTVGGITYNAIDTTNETTAVVTVSQDVDAIVDKVKSFIEDYNKLLSSLYEKYDEKSDSNYKPLTQSQKDGMKEEQITKWEEKAKQGLLYHDSTLQKIILDMRNAISTSIDLGNGETTSVFNIGISTTGLKGQLTLNEDKLRTALSNDSDAVYNVFAKLDVNDMDNSAKMGIAQRLGDVFTKQSTGALARIKTRAGSSSDVTEDSDLNNLLRNLQTKMSNFKKMMNAFEDALYKKYDKMESALARLGTQLNYIMGSSSQ